MKKQLHFLTLFFCSMIYGQTIAIPDANFEQALITLGYDTNGANGNILQSDALAVINLDVSNKNISSLVGIEGFTNIEDLDAANNNLTTLNLTGLTNLEFLYLSENKFTSFDATAATALRLLDLNNQQTGFKLANLTINTLTNLEFIYSKFNDVSSVNLANSLKEVDFRGNRITSIDVSSLAQLNALYLTDQQVGHKLTAIDVSNNPIISGLYVRYNSISTANLANGNTTVVSSLDIRDQNPPLDCIEVSSVAYANNLLTVGWWQKDANTQVSTDCAALNTQNFHQNTILFYPNPVKSILSIENPEDESISSVEIYSITGKLVQQETKNFNQINVENLDNGMYVLKIFTAKGTINNKFIKQ